MLQDPRQLNSSAVDSRLHCALWHRQNRLNLRILQLLQIPQNHCFPQFRRKPRQRALHLRAQFAQQRQLVRPPPRCFLVFHDRHFVIQRVRDAITFCPPVMINQQVSCDARRPGRKSPVRRAVTSQRSVYPEEHILRQVLGFRAVAREPVTDVVDAARMAAHKFLPGRAIALETLLDQLSILLQASSAPSSRHLLRQRPQVGFSACQCMERKMHRKCSRLGAVPTDRLAVILPAPAPTYNSFYSNLLEPNTRASLDAIPGTPYSACSWH